MDRYLFRVRGRIEGSLPMDRYLVMVMVMVMVMVGVRVRVRRVTADGSLPQETFGSSSGGNQIACHGCS